MRNNLVLFALLGLAIADVYMHSMRGSNNRLNEANTNRNNNNRLFDSQNNAKGGYCYGPAMSYYEGSQITLEWTSQHGCGSDKLHCQIVLQYMCGQYNNPTDDAVDAIRDGGTTDTPPNTNADDAATAQEDAVDGMGFKYGQHENFYYYSWCRTRERNKGLYVADRNLNNGAGAAATRQNNGGGQSGYECPEERDYYPYWHPAPWKDIAVLTDDTSLCNFFQSESQNVKDKGYCFDPNAEEPMKWKWAQYNSPTSCTQNGLSWAMYPAWGISKPDCVQNFYQRDNHLGNVGGNNGYAAYYNWTLPTHSDESCVKSNNCNCVLRLRYNISSNDFSGYTAPFADATNNAANSFLKQDPDVGATVDKCTGTGEEGEAPCNVTLAIDTSQFARTFQDRSYVWHLLKRPSKILSTSRIFNLNVKGKRGNIVQAYPSTEYDFHPNDLQVRVGDYIHFQWTGCDTNPAGSAGEGLDGTDRSNIVQIENFGANVPASEAYLKKNPMFESASLRYRMAFLDQGNCSAYTDSNDQTEQNCMNLNAASEHFDAGAIQMNKTGTFFYMNSRNNNFTNRGQKGVINVSLLLPTWGIVMVSIGSALFAGSAGTAGAMIYAKSHPDSKIADILSKF